MITHRISLFALLGLVGLPAVAAPIASPATIAANKAAAAALNWDDRQDFDFATRGFVAPPAEIVVRNAAGSVLRDFNADAQFSGLAPATVNPSLWRNATLVAKVGLFKVADGIWQVRGFDLSNMTVIQGKTGWIIVDPLTTIEAAATALALVNQQLGARPVTGVIYTHSHVDHFGGSPAVVSSADAASGKVPVLAPEGFMAEAISENVIAGPAMLRRAKLMFGTELPTSATGHVSAGLGPVRFGGAIGLVPPNDNIMASGDTRTIDGIRIEFQLTPNTEAPAEMNFYLPDVRALCMAENANGAMHNVLTPRGAKVRDAKGWADYLMESRRLFAGRSDVVFTSHFWPRWGTTEIDRYLLLHAQAYAFVHNESVRLMNHGLNAVEIGEAIALPPPLARAWFNQPNYGSLKFNARAVYQRYLGAFDGDPVSLDPLPRNDIAVRYVAAMGGAAKVLALATAAGARGDDRWAATLLGHLVRAVPSNKKAREALAGRFEQLAWRTATAPWRDFYLTGALELRDGLVVRPVGNTDGVKTNLQVGMVLDALSVRVIPEKALGPPFSIALVIPDQKERHLVTVGNGVMLHEKTAAGIVDATLTVPRLGLLALIGGRATAADLINTGVMKIGGNPAALQRFTGLFEPQNEVPDFPLTLPAAAIVPGRP
jgi:alkyl sulfatase BDS1-like metallo-beta-lactamase superfamily hydrolase